MQLSAGSNGPEPAQISALESEIRAELFPQPPVAVMADKYYPAAGNIPSTEPCALNLPFVMAFEDCYQTDAHFVAYQVVHAGVETFPRLKKTILSQLRSAGCDVVSTMIVLDYDNPEHLPWKPSEYGEWLSRLALLADDWPIAMQWSLLYSTKGGARIVYVLDTPIPVDKIESKIRWLCKQFTEKGIFIPVNQCIDWGHLFRLPNVMRDGVPSWESEYWDYLPQYDNRLKSSDLGDFSEREAQEYGVIVPITGERPPNDCEGLYLATVTPSGSVTQSAFYKEAKRRLRGTACYPCLFEEQAIAVPGGRSSTIFRLTGQAIAILYPIPGCSPEAIYALFFSACYQLEPARDTPDWLKFLWHAICENYAKETAKQTLIAQKQLAERQAALSSLDRISEGMRKWCKNPGLLQEDINKVRAWTAQHLIVSTGRMFLIIGNYGYYDPVQLNQTQLIARINILGLGDTIQTIEQGTNGMAKSVSAQTIINDHCTIVSNIMAMPEIEGAYIENIDTPDARLIIPAYQRNKDLTPEYNPMVDRWLRALFGQQYELGTKWLAWALAWDEGPICALSIAGPAGSGKKMLVQGLCETLRRPRMATQADLVGNVQYNLFNTPFLVVNEGWPKNHQMEPADQFRAFVSGDLGQVRKLYCDPIEIKSPVRVLFTANNLDVVKALANNRDLSADDREALAVRLLHITVTREARDFLNSMKGTELTAKPGARWIAGDSGEESNFVIAKHFLYLYQNRKGPVGARFLIEGNNAQAIMFDMRTGSGSAPLVIETIIKLMEAKNRGRLYPGITVDNGELYVLHTTILEYYRAEIAPVVKHVLTSANLSKVLKGLVKKDSEVAILESRKDLGRKHWNQIDASLLYQVACAEGRITPVLYSLIEEQQARAEGKIVLNPVSLDVTEPSANVVSMASAFSVGEKKLETKEVQA